MRSCASVCVRTAFQRQPAPTVMQPSAIGPTASSGVRSNTMLAGCWDWPKVVWAAPRPTTRIPCRRAKRSIRATSSTEPGRSTASGCSLTICPKSWAYASRVASSSRRVPSSLGILSNADSGGASAETTQLPAPAWYPTTAKPAIALVNTRRLRAGARAWSCMVDPSAGGQRIDWTRPTAVRSWRTRDHAVEMPDRQPGSMLWLSRKRLSESTRRLISTSRSRLGP